MKTLLLGDVCATDSTRNYFAQKDIDALFTNTQALFRDKDMVFANVECAITDSENPIKKCGPNLKSPTETAEMLRELGVTVCGLSNNHIFDYGREGAVDTMKHLSAAGLDYTGFGENYEDSRKNYIFEKNGERICIIAVCEHEYSYALDGRMGSRPYDEYDTMHDIRKAKESCDRVLVMYHGGKEHCLYPSPRLRKLCCAMAENGADVVLCQHTHCIGAYERFEDCHILYGQGNFQFGNITDIETWNTLLAVEYDTRSNEMTFVPIRSDGCAISLAEGSDRDEIMSAFANRSASLENGEWKAGWHAFCDSKRDYYTNAVSRAYLPQSSEWYNEVFAHFLDCEAHTDVWREIFPTWNKTNEK